MHHILTTATVQDMKEPHLAWEGFFLIDTGVVECVLPGRIWDELGLTPAGHRITVLPGGKKLRMECAPVLVELMGGITGTTAFKYEREMEPVLGNTILLSLGIEVEDDGTLIKVPAIRMPGIRLPTD